MIHNSVTVAFNQRYVAEIFVSSSSNIPGIGPTVLSWVANAPTPAVSSTSTAPFGIAAVPQPSGTNLNVSEASQKLNPTAANFVANHAIAEQNGASHGESTESARSMDADMGERDYDIADEDEDRWMR